MQGKDLDTLKTLPQEQLIQMILNQDKRISDLENRVRVLEELQRLARIERYSPKCEQVETLFDEIEVIDTFSEEGNETVVKEHVRKKKCTRQCAQVPTDTPVYTNDHTKGAPEFIIRDDVRFNRIEDKVIDKLAYEPAKIKVERNLYPQYKAECDGLKNIVLFSNQETDALATSASFEAYQAVSKFDDHLPLYRQSEILERQGIRLGRQTMAKWMIAWYSNLIHLERYFTKTMFGMKFLNMDETPLQVLDFRTESGSISKSSFMFIRQGSTYNESDRKVRRLIACSYIQNRKISTLTDDYVTNKSTAAVMTDGLASYNKIEKHCNCWVHAIRSFKKILKDREEKNCKHLVLLFDKLYEIEDRYRKKLLEGELDVPSFLSGRKEESLKVIDQIFSFANSIKFKYPEGAMKKALTYLLERQDTLPNYLDVVEATPDNNAAERVAKAFATGRKNWLFSQTVDGADASCFMYSVIESAKVNNLNPFDYVELLFTFGPSAKTEEQMEALLPWNADISRLSEIREARVNAAPDSHRTEPYVFSGLGR